MKAVFLNPFLEAGLRVLRDEFHLEVEMGAPGLVRSDVTTMPVSVMINVVGRVQGFAMFSMETSVAKMLVRTIVGQDVSLVDDVGESALAEMGNIITGLSTIALEQAGFPCTISPPAVIMGSGVKIMASVTPMVVVPFSTPIGDMRLFLSLQESAE